MTCLLFEGVGNSVRRPRVTVIDELYSQSVRLDVIKMVEVVGYVRLKCFHGDNFVVDASTNSRPLLLPVLRVFSMSQVKYFFKIYVHFYNAFHLASSLNPLPTIRVVLSKVDLTMMLNTRHRTM